MRKGMSKRDVKLIAATLTVVGVFLSILDRIYSPQHILKESNLDYPDILRTLGWLFLIIPPLIYILLDFRNLFPSKKKDNDNEIG